MPSFCIFDNCNKYASYNFIGLYPRYCADHAEDGMVNTHSKNKKCNTAQCNKRASFNYKNQVSKYCFDHAKDGMVNVNTKKCEYNDCNREPGYNYQGQLPKRCSDHRLVGMINVKQKMCDLCKFICQNFKYKPFCSRCYIHIFPDQEVSIQFKIKERYITDYVKEQFEDYKIQCDKTIPNGCSKRRPDILIQLPTHNIIVEVDENQHKSYESTCEVSRVNQLFEDLDHLPLVMIRFNPDAYKEGDTNHKSCFKLNKRNGILIPDKQLLQPRLESLKNEIIKYINYLPSEDHQFKETHLFYDTE